MSLLDYTTFQQTVEEYLAANFTDSYVKFENVPLPKNTPQDWVAVFDSSETSESTGMGDTTYLTRAAIVIQIFTPLNSGTARGRAIAKELSTLFNSESIGGIEFDVPELHKAAPNKSWYQMNLVIPYISIMGQDSTC